MVSLGDEFLNSEMVNTYLFTFQIPWTRFLQTYFPESAFAETEVGVLSEAYFEDISKIISSTADR